MKKSERRKYKTNISTALQFSCPLGDENDCFECFFFFEEAVIKFRRSYFVFVSFHYVSQSETVKNVDGTSIKKTFVSAT